MDDGRQEQANRVDDDMPLPPGHLLAHVEAPDSDVLIDWLSTIAADGLFPRPSACRRRVRRTPSTFAHVPSIRLRRL